mmetsp:Transcript_63965/g.71600  ORF Transcript_63965/g.71600 Transcript_63965/m.71600 type:complete len:123 (-) Transcript_63965:124-492(-)
MMLLLVILLMPPPPQMMTHILYLLYCLAVVDTVIDVATDDVRVSQLRLSPPRQPQTRLKISPGHQNIHDVVIVVKVVVSSSPWSYSTTIMIILYIVSSFSIMEMSFSYTFVSYSCSSCFCQS